MESCFSCFTVKVLKDLRVMTVARERSRLVPLKAMPTGRSTPLPNSAIEIPPVINFDVIRPVSTMPVIVLNHFIFFWQSVDEFVNASQFFKRYVCGSCDAVGFKSG